MRPPVITADGLTPRPWRAADVPALVTACQDPEVPRWTRVPAPYLPEHALDLVGDRAPRAYADGTALPLGVFDAAGALLGSCSFTSLDPDSGDAAVGYWTAAAARGRGVAERAARALIGYGLAERALRRVRWEALVGNHASRLVAARLGFHFDGVDRGRPAACGRPAAPGEPGVDVWTGSLLPGELTAHTADRPGAPGSVLARQAAAFGPAPPAALGDWLVGALGVDRIEWLAYVGNDASRRVAERAGFTVECVIRYGTPDGRRRDCWLASRLDTDPARPEERP